MDITLLAIIMVGDKLPLRRSVSLQIFHMLFGSKFRFKKSRVTQIYMLQMWISKIWQISGILR